LPDTGLQNINREFCWAIFETLDTDRAQAYYNKVVAEKLKPSVDRLNEPRKVTITKGWMDELLRHPHKGI